MEPAPRCRCCWWWASCSLVSLLANWHSLRWDVTREKTQSLSPVSKALLKDVTKPLTMTVFLPEGSA